MGMGMGRYGMMGGGMNRQGPDNSGDWFVPISDEKTTLQKINDWNDATIDLIHIKIIDTLKWLVTTGKWCYMNGWGDKSSAERLKLIRFAFFLYLLVVFIRVRRDKRALI